MDETLLFKHVNCEAVFFPVKHDPPLPPSSLVHSISYVKYLHIQTQILEGGGYSYIQNQSQGTFYL